MASHLGTPASLSVFFPVFNEEAILSKNIERVLALLSSQAAPFEIIIGSNGSTDSTVAIGETLAKNHPQVTFLHCPDRGPGRSFRKAVETMRFDRLVCMDIDLSVDPQFILDAAQKLEDYDLIIGSKKMGVENRGWVRRWGSDLFILVSKHLLRIPYDDFSMGAKAYRKSVLTRFIDAIDTQTAYTQNIVTLSHWAGLKLLQMPVLCDDHRKSRFNLIHEGLYRYFRLITLSLLSRKVQSRNP